MQLLFLQKEDLELTEIDKLDDTERGSNGLVWFYRKVKKIKIVTEEFDFFHKFIESIQYILLLEDRKFVHITHLVR